MVSFLFGTFAEFSEYSFNIIIPRSVVLVRVEFKGQIKRLIDIIGYLKQYSYAQDINIW